MRNTKQKDLIKNLFITNFEHYTAEEIYSILKPENNNLSLGTVYRNLNLFVEQNILRKVEISGEPDRFESSINDKHNHIICTKCGKIIDFNEKDLDLIINKVKKDNNVDISSYFLTIKGCCSNCKK